MTSLVGLRSKTSLVTNNIKSGNIGYSTMIEESSRFNAVISSNSWNIYSWHYYNLPSTIMDYRSRDANMNEYNNQEMLIGSSPK